MNQLIKLTKSTGENEIYYLNPMRIVYAEVTERKKDAAKLTVLHLDSVNENKIIVTETPEEINAQLLKIREIKIVL